MKKFPIIVFLLLISCTPIKKSHVSFTPAFTTAINSSITTTNSPEMTVTQQPYPMVAFITYSTPTKLPDVEETQLIFNVIQKEYNLSEWKVVYDKNSVRQIELGSNGQMWILTGDQVGYFDGEDWILYSKKDYGLLESPDDLAVAPDGTAWLASSQAISHYQDGHWYVYSIPNAPEWSYTDLAINASKLVWLSLWGSHYDNRIIKFDGTNWDEQRLSSDGQVEAEQLLFTLDGTLWASSNKAISQYNGDIWKIYSGKSLWPESNDLGIRIARDSKGNIFGINYNQEWIVKINLNGSISKIPFDFVHYGFISERMRLFVDKQGRIWTNACLKKQTVLDDDNCLEYYQDNQWISFRNLPFWSMIDMKELSDGTLLLATTDGLFQYKPGK